MIRRLALRTLEARMIAILAVSLLLLLGAVTTLEVSGRDTSTEAAGSPQVLNRLYRTWVQLQVMEPDQQAAFIDTVSECHAGYTLTDRAFQPVETDAATNALRAKIAHNLEVEETRVAAGHAELTRRHFSYRTCSDNEIDLPLRAVVVSVQLQSGRWLNAEVHPHEMHWQDLIARLIRYGVAFIAVGALAFWLVRRLSRPLNELTNAARRFGDGLHVSPVAERGPPDLRQAIRAFNSMQRQVTDEVERRFATLAAISHDLRTPLTALRIRAELVDEDAGRADLVASVNKLERMVASALEFLRGESRGEPMRAVDLGSMLASECSDFEETGQQAEYRGESGVHFRCRADALARAVRNLIENANKYADGAIVNLNRSADWLDISVSDTGPGIPAEHRELVVEPFRRLSSARESDRGGFGLGLSVARAVARGHGGELILDANTPTGLIATIRLPAQPA